MAGRAKIEPVIIDPSRRVQSGYVAASDGVRLAIDVWLPVELLAAGETVGAVVRSTRYHRAGSPEGPGLEADTNYAAGDLWNTAGFAMVVIDARGTGASFGTRSGELGDREIADYSEVIDWVASQPWCNGRVGAYGYSYEGQAAELVARAGNRRLVAVAALFSPHDPYRQLFYPGGSATGVRFARWMSQSRIKDGVEGAVEDLAATLGVDANAISLPAPVKPVDGPEGAELLEQAILDHQGNVDVRNLMGQVPCIDDRVDGLEWAVTSPAAAGRAIGESGVPMLIRAGWLDGAFAAGALLRFGTLPNHQEVEIGRWGHGGTTFADTLQPDGYLGGDQDSSSGQDRRLVEFFARYLRIGGPNAKPAPSLTFSVLGSGQWETVSAWPPPGVEVRRLHLAEGASLTEDRGPAGTERYVVDEAVSSGATNRWLAIDLGRGAAYPDRGAADAALLTFTGTPLPADLHVLGFPVVGLRLATTGTDGAVYVYLEDVAPDGAVTYLTEGCLRFGHRQTTGPADPAGLGVPRTFARADLLPVEPNHPLDLVVELQPIAARLRAGHRLRIAIAGHDPACFSRYGPADEVFTVELGGAGYLDLPVRSVPSGSGTEGTERAEGAMGRAL